MKIKVKYRHTYPKIKYMTKKQVENVKIGDVVLTATFGIWSQVKTPAKVIGIRNKEFLLEYLEDDDRYIIEKSACFKVVTKSFPEFFL